MNRKSLKKRGIIGITVLVAFVLLLPVMVNAKNPVRPHHVSAEGYVDLTTGNAYDTGVGTHFGRFSNDWYYYEGYGTITAANGDSIFWEYIVPGVSASISGGTGRFKNASGEVYFTISRYIEGNILFYSYTADGWISY